MSVALPSPAKAKLAALTEAEIDAQAAVRHVAERLSQLNRALVIRPHGEESEGTRSEIARLEAKLARAQTTHQQLAALGSRVRQWLAEQKTESIANAPFKLPKDVATGNAATAVERLRKEIASLGSQLVTVRNAGVLKSELKTMAREWIKRSAEAVRPLIAADHSGNFHVAKPDRGWSSTAPDFLKFMCWFDPAAMEKRLDAEIDATPTAETAMPSAERTRQLESLGGRMLELERCEETIIVNAAAEGHAIARRVNADPRAVLGVKLLPPQLAKAS